MPPPPKKYHTELKWALTIVVTSGCLVGRNELFDQLGSVGGGHGRRRRGHGHTGRGPVRLTHPAQHQFVVLCGKCVEVSGGRGGGKR